MANGLLVQGRVWKLGDAVDTDQILPGYAMACPREELKNYALAGSPISDFSKKVHPGDILVAGANFGCGSSREQAPVALKEAGIALVVAASFARIFRRNAINIGLPVLLADLADVVKDGDVISADVEAGIVTLKDGRQVTGRKPGENVIAILTAGGLINRVRQQLANREGSVNAGKNKRNSH